jgi:hypothetical protein
MNINSVLKARQRVEVVELITPAGTAVPIRPPASANYLTICLLVFPKLIQPYTLTPWPHCCCIDTSQNGQIGEI